MRNMFCDNFICLVQTCFRSQTSQIEQHKTEQEVKKHISNFSNPKSLYVCDDDKMIIVQAVKYALV